MLPASNNEQNRSGQRRGGRTPLAASRAVHTSAARDKAQNGFPPVDFLLVSTGGGFGSRLFSHSRIARRMPSIGLSNRRLVHPLPSGRAATNSRRLIGSKGRAKTVEASLLARIRGAYLDMCQRQASNLLHEIETEAAASGDDLDSDIAASLEALLAKIQAKREALK